MTPSDSPSGPPAVMRSRRRLSRPHALSPGTRRGLSGSWLIDRRPPFRTTPGSSTAAFARCLAVDIRLHQLGKVGRSQIRVSRGRKGFACATADVFAFSGSDGVVTRAAAESATWRTSNFHGQFLSTDKINQIYPDAPERTQVRRRKPSGCAKRRKPAPNGGGRLAARETAGSGDSCRTESGRVGRPGGGGRRRDFREWSRRDARRLRGTILPRG